MDHIFRLVDEQINVLIVGEKNSGKSSVVNLLTNELSCKVSDSTSYRTKLVSSHNVIFNESYFSIIDTPSDISVIQEYLHNEKQELHAIIFLMDRRHISDAKKRRIMFFQQLFPNIFQILVVTKCESEDNMGAWIKDNSKMLYEIFSIKNMISITSIGSDMYFIERKSSRARLLSKLQEASISGTILSSRLLLQGNPIALYNIKQNKYLDIGSFSLLIGTDICKKLFSFNKLSQGLKNHDQVTINLSDNILCPTYLSRVSYSNENILWNISVYENVERFLSVNDIISIVHDKTYLSIDKLGWAILTSVPDYCWKFVF